MRVHIPVSCHTKAVWLLLRQDGAGKEREFVFSLEKTADAYEIWRCECSLEDTGLYFYRFRVQTENESFHLYRWGEHDTNMEEGGLWQLSCVTEEFSAPSWAEGAVMYQIFPDRFYKSGECDLKDKLTPYVLHQNWNESPRWMPDEKGEVWNNDFFGGNLRGIEEKLPYLQTLGVELIYLNPIFMAFSNHRYDTANYLRVDPLLGTEEDFKRLCDTAHGMGMRIILDGVFSHTGSRSVYFEDAANNPESPYKSWFSFKNYPTEYESWWGFKTLPCVKELDPAYLDFIVEGEDSVIAHWLRLGADGFRLDVADELPDEFILRLKRRLRELRPDALLLGEVWEDASNKIAYGQRRRYFIDGELDGVMNYPWRKAVLDFARGSDGGEGLRHALETLAEHYPASALHCTMTMLSSHDSARALTELAAPFEGSREAMAAHRLTEDGRALGIKRLRFAAGLQFFLPGMPSIYYGDEAGMEGCKDPFNRGTYPWGREVEDLQNHFKRLGNMRKNSPVLRHGNLAVLSCGNGKISLKRESKDGICRGDFDATAGTFRIQLETGEIITD
ncbi:MAG: glycoside hydrolase family 13 protein [Oscillospiraceae bacterium]|nr:glycoside hydrolase family 13 protein [Oscillospiraceae bacterium]